MTITWLGWTPKQWAYAKQRHRVLGNNDAGQTNEGMLLVQRWWHSHPWWPEPPEGFVIQSDNDWAVLAIYNAMTYGIANA